MRGSEQKVQRAGSASLDPRSLLHRAERLRPAYLADLATLVAIDSGSRNRRGVNEVADWVCARLAWLGFSIERSSTGPSSGDVVVAHRRASRGAGTRILLAGHMDTVFPEGTAAARPFHVAGDLARGPGVSDDKGGLLAGLYAIQLLLESSARENADLVFLATPDEEIGSPASRSFTESAASDADFALGLECAREDGSLVKSRKGVRDYVIELEGRAAHAGIEPERGANAALAAARMVVGLQDLNGRRQGVTINVGVVRAGDHTNIVCAEAELRLEVRSPDHAGLVWAGEAIENIARHCSVDAVTGRARCLDHTPPMEETPAHLLDEALELAGRLGIETGAVSTGGVGDANLIAGTGVPVLDGLGPIGGADHTPQEWLDVVSVPSRIALLSGLMIQLTNGR